MSFSTILTPMLSSAITGIVVALVTISRLNVKMDYITKLMDKLPCLTPCCPGHAQKENQ
jgi:hypothetical protein